MKAIIVFKYLLFSIIFILGSFFFAIYFKWRIDEAQTGKHFIIIACSLMLCWLGVIFLSVLISRKIIFKNYDKFGFYSPLYLAMNGYLTNEIGIEKARTFKMVFTLIAFPLLFFFVFIFFQITNSYEKYSLQKFGKNEEVKIDKILWDKGGQRAFFSFEYDGQKISKIKYLQDSLKVGQKTDIIFSRNNPYIIKWKSETLSD